jgi:hypothetical protein
MHRRADASSPTLLLLAFYLGYYFAVINSDPTIHSSFFGVSPYTLGWF